MKNVIQRTLTTALLAVAMTAATVAQAPSWPQWRGAARDGVAAFDAPRVWPASLTKVWEAQVGVGHSSPVIANGKVIVHTREAAREVVRAFDLVTGKRLWQDAYDAPYQINPAAQMHGPGPKSTPAIAGGRVFTLGISGVLSACCSARSAWAPCWRATCSNGSANGDCCARSASRAAT